MKKWKVYSKQHSILKTGTKYNYSEMIFARGCRGHDRMVVGFMTTYAICAYHD